MKTRLDETNHMRKLMGLSLIAEQTEIKDKIEDLRSRVVELERVPSISDSELRSEVTKVQNEIRQLPDSEDKKSLMRDANKIIINRATMDQQPDKRVNWDAKAAPTDLADLTDGGLQGTPAQFHAAVAASEEEGRRKKEEEHTTGVDSFVDVEGFEGVVSKLGLSQEEVKYLAKQWNENNVDMFNDTKVQEMCKRNGKLKIACGMAKKLLSK